MARQKWPGATLRLTAGALAGVLLLSGCKPEAVKVPGGLVATQPAGNASTDAQVAATTPADVSPQVTEPTNPPGTGADAFVAASEPPTTESPAPPGSSAPLQASPGLIPVDQASSGRGIPPAAGQPSRTTFQPESATLSIHLSAGVAVPQSLPTGTQMGMSVDYVCRGSLHRSSRYLWVITAAGQEIFTEVKLQEKGNLAAFVMLRPEDRPFSSRIDEVRPDGKRVRISNVAPMQTSY
jgi:hypothetical protein